MPWSKSDYPASMKKLSATVRNKATEIANALLDEKHMDEGIAIATAISRAKDWAANHGKNVENTKGKSKKTDVKEHGKDQYVTPHGDDWALKEEKSKKKIMHTKKEAVKKAVEEAKASNASVTIQNKKGKIESRKSYNPNRKAKTT